MTDTRNHPFPKRTAVKVGSKWAVTAEQAAEILNAKAQSSHGSERFYDANRIYQIAAAGKIKAVKVGNTVLYDKKSVENAPITAHKYTHERKPYHRQVGPKGYPAEKRAEVLSMWETGEYVSMRQLAAIVKIPQQTIWRWNKEKKATMPVAV